MNILITNDDGYKSKGIKVIAETMKQFGKITVIAPKEHQSGMSTAVSLGLKQISYKEIYNSEEESWAYLDATPASCVKFGMNKTFLEQKPDVVISGINHGNNVSNASCYSGTLGAAEEAAINGVPAIGVSLDSFLTDADFSPIEKFFPEIFSKLMENYPVGKGIYYNINFPNLPSSQVKGIRVGHQGKGRWIKEFQDWNPEFYKNQGITPEDLGQSSTPVLEEGEKLYMMVGEFEDDPTNNELADNRIIDAGYISIVANMVDKTDYEELENLRRNGFDIDF